LSWLVVAGGWNDYYGSPTVELIDHHVNAIARLDEHALADDIRMDGKLSPAPIDKHREGNSGGTSEIRQLVERGAHSAPGVKDVIDDDDVHSLNAPWKARRSNNGARADGLQIVAVERNVE
jgi:hypothetical protein